MLAELTHALPVAPPNVGWYPGKISSWAMDGNEKYGDCVFAGCAHAEQLWSTLAGAPNVPTEAEVLAQYAALTGFNPADPSTDNGAVISDVLTHWKTTGLFGSQILDYVGVNPRSASQIREAIWFFGCGIIGLNLPLSAQDQTIWDVPPGGAVNNGEPGSWGGHCVKAGFAGPKLVALITWGNIQYCTYEFLATYCDEFYAVLSPDFIEKSNLTPGGVPLASLAADLKRITVS